jgi:hypothetical protein
MMISFISLLSVGGAYATWHFADREASLVQDQMNIVLMDFEFAPEQILPGAKWKMRSWAKAISS